MSEWIDNSSQRKQALRELILKLHGGETTEDVRRQLQEGLKSIPYGEVVEVEQQLIQEGLPAEEVLRLCDAHSAVLRGAVDTSAAPEVPPGHPVDVFRRENEALRATVSQARDLVGKVASGSLPPPEKMKLVGLFNQLYDVDKHYLRKEYLLFPALERAGITGPPQVMWGKHDEIRALMKGALEALGQDLEGSEGGAVASLVLTPALNQIVDMTEKEDEILLPMTLDKLSETDWIDIDRQTLDIGYCLYDPPQAWLPKGNAVVTETPTDGTIRLPSGQLKMEELLAILNTLPVDITFVDRDDKVKYFSQGSEWIFQRNRAILGRDVRLCHPPGSAHIVDTILQDFKSGRADRAPFWIQKGGQFVHIEYFALRGTDGAYLGTLEMSQNLTGLRALEGEQRILNYASGGTK